MSVFFFSCVALMPEWSHANLTLFCEASQQVIENEVGKLLFQANNSDEFGERFLGKRSL